MNEYVYDPAKGFPRVVPERTYSDPERAAAWLSRAFGFTELLRWADQDGIVRHVDMALEGGIIMLSGGGEDELPPVAREASLVVFFVDDVDAHYAHAVKEGATVVQTLRNQPWGLRQYVAEDLTGHRWEFTGFVRAVTPEEWGAVTPE